MGRGLDLIKHAKAQIDIVEVIGKHVALKRDGANYIGLSPFSQERTCSFVVNPVKNIFKCFSSGKSGDAIDFIRAIKGLSYQDALSYLAIEQPSELKPYIAPIQPPISYTPREVMFSTLRGYNSNDFAQWLIGVFGMHAIDALAKYMVGTSKHWPGACIFWYCDDNGCRGGKIMSYNPETGKRIKEPRPLITWVHKVLKTPDYNLSVCIFGEHLLPGDMRDVHIFESEKTAICASLCYPDWLCLASGSLTNLTYDRCKVLEGRNVFLHPDVGGEVRWMEKMLQLHELIPATWDIAALAHSVKGYDFCDWILDNLI